MLVTAIDVAEHREWTFDAPVEFIVINGLDKLAVSLNSSILINKEFDQVLRNASVDVAHVRGGLDEFAHEAA